MELQLRWSDEDALGHVNNARIVTLMEEARIRWTQPRGDSGRFPFGTVVASLQLELPASAVLPADHDRPAVRGAHRHQVVLPAACGNPGRGQPVFDGTSVMVPLAEDEVSSRALSDLERAWLDSAFVAVDA